MDVIVKQGNKKKASEKKTNEPKNISIEHIFVYLFCDYFFMHSNVDRKCRQLGLFNNKYITTETGTLTNLSTDSVKIKIHNF